MSGDAPGRVPAPARVEGGDAGPPLRISLVAAVDRQGAIGKDNALPWRLPDDLRRFKALTLGRPVLMGRRTAESLGRALPGRTNLVLTRSGRAPFAGMRAVATMAEALDLAAAEGAGELCVIGGAEIYALALPLATDLRMTHVDTAVVDPDAVFPDWNAADWLAVSRESHDADGAHAFAFEFVDYIRRASARS